MLNLVRCRSKQNYIVDKIKNCGWYFEEDLGHFTNSINSYDLIINL